MQLYDVPYNLKASPSDCSKTRNMICKIIIVPAMCLEFGWPLSRFKDTTSPPFGNHHALTSAVAGEPVDGQLTRANARLAVRSGVLTEAESSRYWQARRRYRTLSDSISTKTIEKVTQEFEAARTCVLERMHATSSDALERERGEKRRLAEEVESLKRRLADALARAS